MFRGDMNLVTRLPLLPIRSSVGRRGAAAGTPSSIGGLEHTWSFVQTPRHRPPRNDGTNAPT